MSPRRKHPANTPPEPFIVAPRRKMTARDFRALDPRPVPPVEVVIEALEQALARVQFAEKELAKAHRSADLFQIRRYVNDLEYRLLPRVNATACTHCEGYRGANPPGKSCPHQEAS